MPCAACAWRSLARRSTATPCRRQPDQRHGEQRRRARTGTGEHQTQKRGSARSHRPDEFVGVTGAIPLSACLDDLGEVFLARVEKGRYRYYSRADLAIPQGVIHPRDRVSRKVAKGR